MEGFPVCGLTKPCVSVDAVRTPEMTYSSMLLAHIGCEDADYNVDFEASYAGYGGSDGTNWEVTYPYLHGNQNPLVSRHALASEPGEGSKMRSQDFFTARFGQPVQPVVEQSLNAGSHLAPNIHNEFDLNNRESQLAMVVKNQSMVVKAQSDLLLAFKQIDRLKGSFFKLNRKCVALERKISEVEREKEQLKQENMQLQLQLQPQHQQQRFDDQGFLSSAHE